MMKKKPTANQKGLKKLPQKVRNKMGYMSKGGKVKAGYAMGGSVTGMSSPNQNYTANNSYNPVEAGMQQGAMQRAAMGIKSEAGGNMAKGGKVKSKKNYKDGGKIYANCGASVKPNGTSRK